MNDNLKKSLEHRKTIKSKKPAFTKQDTHKKPKLSSTYRRPRGLQSKMRLCKKGYKRTPSCGYGSPKLSKNLTADGYKPFIVSNVKDLELVDSKSESIIISSTVGRKKKIEILKIALEKKFVVSNIKDVKEHLANLEKLSETTKKQKQKKLNERSKKKDAKEKALSKKTSVEEKVTEEEKKEEQKKEKDKIIQKKQ
jgi:large subunit ribosomal protein L32e